MSERAHKRFYWVHNPTEGWTPARWDVNWVAWRVIPVSGPGFSDRVFDKIGPRIDPPGSDPSPAAPAHTTDRAFRDALERIALLDEADGHELTAEHALKAVGIACHALGKHPSEVLEERQSRAAHTTDAMERATKVVGSMGVDVGEDKALWPETWRRRISAAVEQERQAILDDLHNRLPYPTEACAIVRSRSAEPPNTEEGRL